jgi:four helix bundle protein
MWNFECRILAGDEVRTPNFECRNDQQSETNSECGISNGAEMSQELKNRTKKFALDVIGLCAGLPHLPETRHAIDQLIRSSSSVAANYRSACRGKSKADFIAKLGIVEEEADESGFWLEMLRDVCELPGTNSEPRTHHPLNRSRNEIRHSQLHIRTSSELSG